MRVNFITITGSSAGGLLSDTAEGFAASLREARDGDGWFTLAIDGEDTVRLVNLANVAFVEVSDEPSEQVLPAVSRSEVEQIASAAAISAVEQAMGVAAAARAGADR